VWQQAQKNNWKIGEKSDETVHMKLLAGPVTASAPFTLEKDSPGGSSILASTSLNVSLSVPVKCLACWFLSLSLSLSLSSPLPVHFFSIDELVECESCESMKVRSGCGMPALLL
jgi:hypothetical protein